MLDGPTTPTANPPIGDHPCRRTHRAVCDGGGGVLGHPRVFLRINATEAVICPYCSRLYVLNAGAGHDEGHHERMDAVGSGRGTAGQQRRPRNRISILIDGSGFIFRAYHALPPMTRGDGTPVNAVLWLHQHAGAAAARACRHPYRGDLRRRPADLPQSYLRQI